MKKKIFIGAGLAIITTICFGGSAFALPTAADHCNVSGTNNSSTTKDYCAGSLYRKYPNVQTKCKDSYDAAGCKSEILSHLQCPGMPSGTPCESTESTYAEGVRTIIHDNDVNPCKNITYDTALNSCLSTHWKYYYNRDCERTGTCDTATPTTPSTPDTPSDGGNDDGSSGGTTGGDGTIADVNKGSCATILTAFCDDAGNVDIGGLIGLIITIFTGMIVLAGTVGIIVCGFMWMSARDNEAQVAKAKKRMLEVVVGIIAWVLLALLANLFIPKKSTDIEDNIGGDTGIGVITAPVTPPSSGGGSTGDDPSTPTTPGDGSWNRLCGPDPSVAIDKSVYGQRTTLYTNKFGRTFYRYQQSDELWSGLPAGTNSSGNQGTLYSRGCYRTSIAVMFNSFGLTDFTPAKLSTESGGMDIDLAMSKYPKSKDYMTATYYSSDKSSWKTKIINAISGGGGVIFLIEKKDGVTNDFTTSMHKMPAIDYDSSNGKVFISNTTSTKSGWYDLDYLVTSDKVNAVGIVIVMPKDSSLKCKN